MKFIFLKFSAVFLLFLVANACHEINLEDWDDFSVSYQYDAYWDERDPLQLTPKQTGKCKDKKALNFDVNPKGIKSALKQGLFLDKKTGTINMAATAHKMFEKNKTTQDFLLYYHTGKKLKKVKIQVELIDIPSNSTAEANGRIERPGFRVRVSSLKDGAIEVEYYEEEGE